jgi:CRP/FNR family cyclic AMP-dependent transcriptional regulator
MQESKQIAKRNVTGIDPYFDNLLKDIGVGKHVSQFNKNTRIFCQGDEADAVYFIRSGMVKVIVLSDQGREAVLAMVGPREFFGEGCLAGQPFRMGTAKTLESSSVFRVQKQAMLQALHAPGELSEIFTAALVTRNIDLEEDLCDQLFNHSEKRLGRVLLKLCRFDREAGKPNAKVPRLSHETLADMVGTTRSRITFFMNKFRRLGLIEYEGTGDITVKDELAASLRMSYLAKHDAATDLPNRSLLIDRLTRALALSKRYRSRLAVLCLNLDRFEKINDSLGRAIGDQALRQISDRLVKCARSSDTVSRIGADKFVVLLAELERVEDAAVSAGKIIAAVTAPLDIADHEVHLTLSVGVSIYPDDGDDAESLIQRADSAMCCATAEGPGQCKFFSKI